MKLHMLLAAVVAGCLLFAGSAHAQFSVTITVDENGHGNLANGNGVTMLPTAMQADPGPGGLPSALTYDLLNPPGLTAGDFLLVEPGLNGEVSDIVRFNPSEIGPGGGTGSLVFYSDIFDGSDSLADTGFPTTLYDNNLARVEVGPEGANGFTYTPTTGEPGFVAGAAGTVSYVIQSDTPEPGALTLLGLAAGAGLLRRRSRRVCNAD